MEYDLWLEGEWGEDRKVINLDIVYAHYDGKIKATLWSKLVKRIEVNKEENVWLMGTLMRLEKCLNEQ